MDQNSLLDVDRYDPLFHQIMLWNEKRRCIEGVMRVRQHDEGLSDSYVEKDFSIGQNHPLRRNRVFEVGRLAMKQGGVNCDVMWRIAARTMAWTDDDLIVGCVTVDLGGRNHKLAGIVEWARHSASPEHTAISPVFGPDPYKDPSKPVLSHDRFSYDAAGVRKLKDWAVAEGLNLPPLLSIYARVSGYRGHYDAICKDRDFQNEWSFLHWGRTGDASPLARRMLLSDQECQSLGTAEIRTSPTQPEVVAA